MSEIKIARFVDIEARKKIFSENSTFVLRSTEHYRRLHETTEEKTSKGDKNEGRAEMSNGGTAEYSSFVVSCRTKPKGTKPASDEWDIFKENKQNIVAIVSTPTKVCEFLNKTFETNKEHTKRKFPFWPVQHKEVKYEKALNIDHTNIHIVVPFAKNQEFINQKEYRFIMEYSQYPHRIDSYIFLRRYRLY